MPSTLQRRGEERPGVLGFGLHSLTPPSLCSVEPPPLRCAWSLPVQSLCFRLSGDSLQCLARAGQEERLAGDSGHLAACRRLSDSPPLRSLPGLPAAEPPQPGQFSVQTGCCSSLPGIQGSQPANASAGHLPDFPFANLE